MRPLWVIDLGSIGYGDALDLQHTVVDAKKAGADIPDVLFLLEHPPVLTLGRNADESNIVTPMETLDEMGFDVYHVERGGDVTYHGPGQLVGYPILNLRHVPRPKDVGWFVWGIQEALIKALAPFGIAGERIENVIGVWVCDTDAPDLDESFDAETREALKDTFAQFSDRKIAAIGARIEEWISYHGFALNVNTNLHHFDLIVPCGLQDRGVTSMQQELHREIPLEDVKAGVMQTFADVFEYEPRLETLTALEKLLGEMSISTNAR